MLSLAPWDIVDIYLKTASELNARYTVRYLFPYLSMHAFPFLACDLSSDEKVQRNVTFHIDLMEEMHAFIPPFAVSTYDY